MVLLESTPAPRFQKSSARLDVTRFHPSLATRETHVLNNRAPEGVTLDGSGCRHDRRRDGHHAKYQWLKTGGWEPLTPFA
jgi:hypothetical protein